MMDWGAPSEGNNSVAGGEQLGRHALWLQGGPSQPFGRGDIGAATQGSSTGRVEGKTCQAEGMAGAGSGDGEELGLESAWPQQGEQDAA